MLFSNKKIFILGMARSGFSAAKLLAKHNNKILITDMKEQNEDDINELKNIGANFVQTDKPEELLTSDFDVVIKNPGVHPEHPLCQKANKLSIPITNEMEVAYSFLPEGAKIIGISGSNGKTTTTTIIYNILKKANLPVHLGGNIGYPLCSIIESVKPNDILVLEISSHQLNDFIDFKTDMSILTNLSEVHIDHFGTYENYKAQKVKIFNHHTDKNIGIINKDNLDSMDYIESINSNKILFSSTQDADICIKENFIVYKNENIIDLSNIKLKGNHNYENIMAAIVIAKEFNISNDVILDVLKDFGGVEHRLEFVRNVNDREFYNDSKATNVKSTQIALSAFSSPTILILGGLDRGHSFDELKEYLKNVKLIVCYGETKNRIKTFADSLNIKCNVVDNLTQATITAYNNSEKGNTILLSPACASWDQYKCFEDRGEEFKKVVNEIK